jgi:hypothetical protein
MVENIEEYYKEALVKYNFEPLKKSNERVKEPDEIEKRKQHRNILEEKYGFGKAYGILKLFERYEELKTAFPNKDIVEIEEIEKIIIQSLFYLDSELSYEQDARNSMLHSAFIKKYRLESKINKEIKQQNEKKLARIREERRPELERKYGKGKSIEDLLKVESDEKRRIELERKYGKGKSLEELERLGKLESDEKRRIELERKYRERKSIEELERNRQYWKDLYG